MNDKEIIDNATNISHFFIWVAVVCMAIGLVYTIVKFFDKDTIKEIKEIIFGKDYIVKVNGVWSLCRGWEYPHNHSLRGSLNIRYGPDKHKWILNYRDWIRIDDDWSKAETEKTIIEKNVSELKKLHPKKNKKILITSNERIQVDETFEEFIRRVAIE